MIEYAMGVEAMPCWWRTDSVGDRVQFPGWATDAQLTPHNETAKGCCPHPEATGVVEGEMGLAARSAPGTLGRP